MQCAMESAEMWQLQVNPAARPMGRPPLVDVGDPGMRPHPGGAIQRDTNVIRQFGPGAAASRASAVSSGQSNASAKAA